MLLWVCVNERANGGLPQCGIEAVFAHSAVEHAVQLLFDDRACEQRKLRVVDAQVHSQPCRWHIAGKHRQCHIKQSIDIGHADQAEAHLLLAAGIEIVILRRLV